MLVSDGSLDASAVSTLTVTPSHTGGSCTVTDPNANHYPVWDSSTVYTAVDTVQYDQLVWKAKYWTQNNQPSRSADQWQLLSQVQLGWDKDVVFNSGDMTVHNQQQWQASYWTKGDEPGTAAVWTLVGPATCD